MELIPHANPGRDVPKGAIQRQALEEEKTMIGKLAPKTLESPPGNLCSIDQRILQAFFGMGDHLHLLWPRQVQSTPAIGASCNSSDRRFIEKQPRLGFLDRNDRNPRTGKLARFHRGRDFGVPRIRVSRVRISVKEKQVCLGLQSQRCLQLRFHGPADGLFETSEINSGPGHLIGAQLNAQVLEVRDDALIRGALADEDEMNSHRAICNSGSSSWAPGGEDR